MICNHKPCSSPDCPHKTPHAPGEFCGEGFCKPAGVLTHCEPEDPKEAVTHLLTGYVDDDLLGTLVDQIIRVFKEVV